MDTSTLESSGAMNTQPEVEDRRAAAKRANQERRRKLIALGPQFVEVIKLGQAFVRFTEDAAENVFVWFDQDAGRSGCLRWEPLLPEAAAGDASAALLQPKSIDPERTLKFSSISDIFMGRSNDVLKAHGPAVNTKLCVTFAAHEGTGHSLHLMARSRPQMEAWIYGIQHILKQGGFQFVEANEQADKRERAIFEQCSAKQLVRLIMKKDPSVAELRLQATLTHMNRGQNFTRYLPNGLTEEVFVFFCSDGGKGTLFWGQRSKPDGYLPLRTVTDMWLGKHGLLTQDVAVAVDPSHCMSLASKKAMLAIEAPAKAVMTQWVYGIHSLLTASPELLQEINQNQPQQRAQPVSAGEVAAAADAVRQMQEEAAASSAVDGDAAFQAEAAAALAALRNLSLVNGADAWTVEEIDMSALDQEALAHADAVEEEAEQLRVEFEKAVQARQQLEQARKEQELATKRAVAVAGDAAESAIAAARALREAAEARAREAALAMSRVMERAEEAYGGESGLAETMELQEEEEEDGEEKKEEAGDVMDEDEDLRRRHQPRGRRLSLFSSLELDEDVRNALTFDNPAASPAEEGEDGAVDVEYTGADDEADNGEAADNAGEGDETGNADGDEWTTLNFDMDLNTDNLNADNFQEDLINFGEERDGQDDSAAADAVDEVVAAQAEVEAQEAAAPLSSPTEDPAEPVRRPVARKPAASAAASAAAPAAAAAPRTPLARPPTATTRTAAATAATTAARPVSAAAKSAGSKLATTAPAPAAKSSVAATPRPTTATAKSAGTKSASVAAAAPTATPKRVTTGATSAAASGAAAPVRKSAAAAAGATSAAPAAAAAKPVTARSSAAAAPASAAAAAPGAVRAPVRKPATKLSIHMDDAPATPAKPVRPAAAGAAATPAGTAASAGVVRPKSSATTGARPTTAGTSAGGMTARTSAAASSTASKSAAATKSAGAKK